MLKYIIKRILWAIPVVICVAVLIFSIMRMAGGDPARQLVGIDATDEEYEAMRAKLRLDDPFFVQLADYLGKLFLKGDLGTSYMTHTSISKDMAVRLPYSLAIGGVSILVATLIGVWLGMQSAIHAGKWQDKLCMVFALGGVSMPKFWLALLLLLLFAVKLQWLPAAGVGGIQFYILPVLANSFHGIASFARQSRSSMLEVIRSDYVITAKAKGLSFREVIYKHALPNALIPVVTMIGTQFAVMISGSIVIETIFSIPGLGVYLTTGINNRDYPCACVLSHFSCV